MFDKDENRNIRRVETPINYSIKLYNIRKILELYNIRKILELYNIRKILKSRNVKIKP